MTFRRLEECLEVVFKTCLVDLLKTCFEDVLKTCLEDILKTSWRQTKYLLGISVSNKSKCVSNKDIFHKSIFGNSKVNPKCISSIFVLFGNSSSITISRIKISDGCLVLRNQLNLNSTSQKK